MKIQNFTLRLSETFYLEDLRQINRFLDKNEIIKSTESFSTDPVPCWNILVFYNSKNKEEILEDLNDEQNKIYDALKSWRYQTSKRLNIPAFRIFTNSTLTNLAKNPPKSKENLFEIKGMSKNFINEWGDEIMELLDSI